MATVIAKKGIKAAAIHSVLKLAWARLGSVEISDVSDKIIRLVFENEGDREHIFEMSS